MIFLAFFCFFFFLFLADNCPFVGPLAPLFWISSDISSGFQSQSGFCLIRYFCGGECNVHSPRFTSGATLADLLAAGAQLVTSPHACAEVGLGSDSNVQPHEQKTNALPLCLPCTLFVAGKVPTTGAASYTASKHALEGFFIIILFVAGRVPTPGAASYTASKHALEGFLREPEGGATHEEQPSLHHPVRARVLRYIGGTYFEKMMKFFITDQSCHFADPVLGFGGAEVTALTLA